MNLPNKRPENMERITNKKLAEAFIAKQVRDIRAQVGDRKVLLALSGGVDSSVVAALLIKAIGRQLVCVHVNHGLMRKGESEQVIHSLPGLFTTLCIQGYIGTAQNAVIGIPGSFPMSHHIKLHEYQLFTGASTILNS